MLNKVRPLSCGLIVLLGAVAAEAAAPTDAETRVAFARLYGVVRWFHPSDAGQEIDWNRFAVKGTKAVRGAHDAAQLARVLEQLFAPVAVDLSIASTLPAESPSTAAAAGPLVAWRHAGLGFGAITRQGGLRAYASARTNREAGGVQTFEAPLVAGVVTEVDLGLGLRARVPLVLTDSDATISAERRANLDAFKRELDSMPERADPADVDVATADVVVAWSALRHFYPYWTEAEVDWDARLRPLLEGATAATSREAHRNALRRLMAEIRDGHGRVSDPGASPPGYPPFGARKLQGRLVVTASATEKVKVGDVITTIDGTPAAAWLTEQEGVVSGSPHWRATVAARAAGPQGSTVALELDGDGRAVRVEVTRDALSSLVESRPGPVSQIRPDTWYIDLTRAGWPEIQAHLEKVSNAAGIVFDMRGYPAGDAGHRILAHLMDAAERRSWMHIPQIVEPFGEISGWRSTGWGLSPRPPHLIGHLVFLTDARAISSAESLMGYVEALHLPIVGTPTAGTNGNANFLTVPSGFTISFTGMRVTRHDGTPLHLQGIQPTLIVEPTPAGIRAGRDEVLERALALVTEGEPPL